MRFKARRCATLEQIRVWVEEERRRARENTDAPSRSQNEQSTSVAVRGSPCQSVSSSQLVANAALSLLNLACYLLDKQIAALEKNFVEQGGFTERLYRVRRQRMTRD
jgi:four helix bundle suffix protein